MPEELEKLNNENGESVVVHETDKDLDSHVEELLERDAEVAELLPHVDQQDPADAADTLERLEADESLELLDAMDDDRAAEALAQVIPELAATMLRDLPEEYAAVLLSRMPPDDAADLTQALPRDVAAGILSKMHPKSAAKIGKLAVYDPESAGGMMTTDIMVVRQWIRIGEAIDAIKRNSINEVQSDVYVVDENKELVGTIRLRTLLIEDDNDAVADHMTEMKHTVPPDMDREDVARLFERLDLITMPVVDARGRILGMVTIDDIVDTLTAEATEDALKQVGSTGKEGVHSKLWTKLKGRLPWLMMNVPLAALGAAVILQFEELITELAIVAVLYPIIANQAGNTGHQSMAITLRGLVLGEIRKERVLPLVFKEVGFGAVAGVVIGLIFLLGIWGLGAAGIDGLTLRVGVIAGVSMAGALTVSSFLGTGTPLMMDRAGLDPATASSILITMLTDAVSYFTFLGLAFVTKAWVMG